MSDELSTNGAGDALNLALRRLQRLMASRRRYASQAEAAGVSLSQQAVLVLRAVAEGETRPVADVARAARMDVGAVSRQLRKLEDEQLVVRSPSPTNASVVLVEATPAGREVARQFDAAGAQHLENALDDWRPEDRQLLGDLLLRLVDDLQQTPYAPLSR